MLSREFVKENKRLTKSKISSAHAESTRGLHLFTDNTFDRIYMLNRIMMATASADGVNDFEMPADSWAGKNNTAHPYSDIESAMLKQAYKKTGVRYKDLNDGNNDSLESDSTNIQSPIAGFKGWKR